VKTEPPQHLRDAIAATQDGTAFLGPHAAQAVQKAKKIGRPGLSPQERRVLLAWLHTDNKDTVARHLHVAPSTIRTHLQRIRRRYELVGRPANSKAMLLARALQDGLLAVGDL
jgi:DNA-binding NarL/FixJ family response regulator